jgi:hypothetical protein
MKLAVTIVSDNIHNLYIWSAIQHYLHGKAMNSQQEPAVAVGQNYIDLAFIHAEAPRRCHRLSSAA